jgi:uncharacterized protein YecT (DUF1311 family)
MALRLCCIVALLFSFPPMPVLMAQVATASSDPCSEESSNSEMRECYAREQARVNAEAERLARQIAADHLKEATDPANKGAAATCLKKAASMITASQKSWKNYRDQHCKAVLNEWTTGSGAGTAYESCMFEVGSARVKQLQADFILE